ncbi:MAG: hypothetical protein HRT73_14940 [Flavobacteriales bacterium]|nr:hypothetical protein [Flavobacteriales bacterium]
MKYFNYTLLILLITPCLLFSQTILVEGEIKWKENAVSKIDALNSRSFLAFDNVSYDSEKDFLGFYVKQIKLNQEKIIGLNILNIGYEDVDENTLKGTSGFEYIKNLFNDSPELSDDDNFFTTLISSFDTKETK